MGEIGQHRKDVAQCNCLVSSVDALGELIESQSSVTARGLEDFDDPFTVVV
jgi:hypothetical protein